MRASVARFGLRPPAQTCGGGVQIAPGGLLTLNPWAIDLRAACSGESNHDHDAFNATTGATRIARRAGTDIAVLTRVSPHAAAGLIGASVLSAIEQALTDILAQDAGLPVYGWLGNHRRASFPAYANINRATTDRSPAGCAASARRLASCAAHNVCS